MNSSSRYWAGIPEHILDLIWTKFSDLSDCFCFSAVCSQYRSNVVNLNPSMNIYFNILRASNKKVPMLMIKTEENIDENRGLYNILDKITYNVRLPLPYKYRFIGSSHGWLLCVDKNFVITLLDPFRDCCISLPIFRDASKVLGTEWDEDIFDFHISKAMLTSDPHINPNNYEVVVIYGGMCKLAHYNSSQNMWNFIKLVPEGNHVSADIICYKGCIYTVSNFSELLQIDCCSGTVKTIIPSCERDAPCFYLVESQDRKLLLVKRYWNVFERDTEDDYFEKTHDFKVCKLVHLTGEKFATWKELDSIGEQSLFVGGGNHSLSISTAICSKFQRNSIYYTAHGYLDVFTYKYQQVDEDTGIFNLEDKSFHSHQVLGHWEEYRQPPVWFVPNLN